MKLALPLDAKLLAFDLETADLSANRGHIICAAAKWVGKRECMTWRIDDAPNYRKTADSFFNDKHIVEALVPLLEEADAVIAYYGSGFDVPYVNTRALVHGVRPPVPFTLIDPWRTARSRLKLARNDMGSVATLVGARYRKTHLPWEDWQLAKYGDSASISKLLKYNINDIRVLEDVYLKTRSVMQHHPYIGSVVAGVTRCPACGSGRRKSHDVRRTRTFEVYRARCVSCGTNFETHRRKIAA